MQLFQTQLFQITPLASQDLVTPSVDLVTDPTSMLASVPASKLAQLEARVARVPLPSEFDSWCSLPPALLGVLGERGAVYPGILVGVPNQALQFAGRIFCFESCNLTC